MSSPTLLESLARGVEAFFEPLAQAAEDSPAGREQLSDILQAIGVDVETQDIAAIRTSLSGFVTAYESVTSAAGGDASLQAILDLLAAAQDVVRAVDDLPNALQGVDPDQAVQGLLEYLAAMALQRNLPHAYYAGVLLTVIEVETPEDLTPGERSRLEIKSQTSAASGAASLELDRIADLLDSPVEELKDFYLPDGQISDEQFAQLEARVLPWLASGAAELGLSVDVGDAVAEPAPPYDRSDVSYSRRITVSKRLTDSVRLSASLALANTPDGIALLAASSGNATAEEQVGGWEVAVSLSGETAPSLLHPDRIEPLDSSASPEATATVGLSKLPDSGSDNAFVLGPTEGTRLELGTVGVEGSLTATDAGLEGGVQGGAEDSAFVVDAGNADSFIQKIMPEEGIAIDFDAGIGYHTERGLYFTGGAGIATEIPVNLDIAGVLKVETLRLAAQVDPDSQPVTVPVHVATDPQVSIGPMDGVVEGIGLEAELAFPQGSDGNLGPVHVDLGFKPPTGAGMSLDAGVVSGGGFLSFDHENERYAGVLQLKIGELTITAVGLLSTQLPGGRDGYSLLLIISGEFPAFQLGFGFTLDGLGGLVGANRAMDVDYLMAGVSDGTVRSIMFPDDPVRNAPQIISDLRSGFPVAAGNHVVGPMAKLGWGTPSMLSASIGVLLDLPNPVRVVIIGRLHMGLPHEEIGIVVFNMDLLGAVDPEAQTANGAATLYDSRIVAYVISGDMAVKTGWGDAATFVLSVGGFNPRFEPPDEFPSLDRIALSIGPGNPEVRFAGYFAVTSNTAQVGASVQAHAEAAGFAFDGKMGFDTLFRFEPFELIADFYAGFSLRKGGSTIMSVDVDGTLKGPGPWHLNGKASFEIWPVNFDVSIDAEFGPSKSAGELSPADVYGQVVSAIEDSRNWSAQRPASGESVVTLRELEREGDQVLAHPLGTIAVRQQVAPLGVRIEKFGNGKPAGHDRFSIETVTVGGSPENDEATREQFAPAEYFELSDDEKLEGPEFERYDAGSRVANTGFGYGGSSDGSLLASDPLDYETAIIDEQASPFPVAVGRVAMPLTTASAVAEVSAVARGPLRTTGEARFEVTDDETGPTGVDASLSMSDPNYVVARAEDLTQVDLATVPADGTTKREAREALEEHVAETGGDSEAFRVVGAHEAASQGASG